MMRATSILAAICLSLTAADSYGLPTIHPYLVDNDSGAISVISDQPADVLQIEIAAAWGSEGVDPFRITNIALASEMSWTPITANNPLTGNETIGIYYPEGATHFFASFQTTNPAAVSSLSFLEFDWAGSQGVAMASARITLDGASTNISYPFGFVVGDSWGDMEPDGDIDIMDFGIFADAFGSVSGSPRYNWKADTERDGDVDIIDFGWFADAYGSGAAASVPEPTSALMLSLSLLGLLRRR